MPTTAFANISFPEKSEVQRDSGADALRITVELPSDSKEIVTINYNDGIGRDDSVRKLFVGETLEFPPLDAQFRVLLNGGRGVTLDARIALTIKVTRQG